jgi:uncharacterized protein (DUF983 family)
MKDIQQSENESNHIERLSEEYEEKIICPKCKKGKLYDYVTTPWMKVGFYQCGDWVCNKCKTVFVKDNDK